MIQGIESKYTLNQVYINEARNNINIYVNAGEGYLDCYKITINHDTYVKDKKTGKIDLSVLKPYIGCECGIFKNTNGVNTMKLAVIKSVTGNKKLSKVMFDNIEDFLDF